jgi:hypothetical protein
MIKDKLKFKSNFKLKIDLTVATLLKIGLKSILNLVNFELYHLIDYLESEPENSSFSSSRALVLLILANARKAGSFHNRRRKMMLNATVKLKISWCM